MKLLSGVTAIRVQKLPKHAAGARRRWQSVSLHQLFSVGAASIGGFYRIGSSGMIEIELANDHKMRADGAVDAEALKRVITAPARRCS